MKCSFCGGSNFKEWDGEYICKDCGTRNKKETTSTTTTAKPLSTAGAVGVCEICGGKDFKEYMGKKICKNCGSPLKATSTTTSKPTTTTSTTTSKPLSTTTTVGVCEICGGKDFKEYMGKKICKNCGSPLKATSTTTTTSKPTTTTSTTTSKPLSTANTSAGVCKICGGKDFKEYLGRKICKNCGSPLETTSTTTTTTTSTPTTSTTTSKPRTTKTTTKSTTTSKPLSTPTPPVTETVSTPPVRYKYDFSIVFKPSVKLFGFESFTKDKKIADEILNYLLSKKYKVSEGYGESSDTEIYSKAIIVVGTKAEYIDSKINEKLNSYKRDSERLGKSIVYYVYDKSIPNGLPIDVSNTESFDSNGDDFLETLSKRFIEESGKY